MSEMIKRVRVEEYVLLVLLISLVFLILNGLTRDNKDQETTHPADELIVETLVIKDNWEDFIQAVIIKESRGDSLAVGRNDDVGVLQITPIIVRDVNRILGGEKYMLSDRTSVLKSVEMFNIIQDYYNPAHDFHFALKIWNPKAPISYHRDIMYIYDTIQSNKIHSVGIYHEPCPVDPVD